ncbi:MAG: PorV/PorQ family protein, partial [Chitinophagales bacterium]|nr:PorV/PorQ family protein [Chitinophagales bacterium]
MYKNFSLIVYFLLVFFVKSNNIYSQTGWVKNGEKINTVTTALPFLRINSDARAGGMGDVGIATTPDINAAFLNPSNMAFVEKDFAVGVSFTPWLKRLVNDIYLTSLTGYGKIRDKNGRGEQAIGGSIRYFSLGNIDFTDEQGAPLGSFRPNEFSVDAWYARKLAKNFSLGAALRFAYSNLAGGQSANGNVIRPAIAGAGDINWTWRQNFKKDG